MSDRFWYFKGNREAHNAHSSFGQLPFIRCVLLLALCIGCGGSEHPLAPVSGEVFYKDKPLAHGTITFLSSETRQATGEIIDGKIVNVTTFSKNDGAPVGMLTVAITAYDRSEEHRNSMVPPSLIPRRYADHATSELAAKIVPGETNKLRFDLE